ncbi:adhesion G protein-coupled receptor E2 isoform X1 [Cyprinus carpio]|uniref:Adhesion G protein-coupled receptor E2 isoform X1 n=2 Tax=Cyprinus carpio TaxID=7962 RepID=A0A9Q9W2P5_CYPCA|nr:adhesion G protein-coupled receptor E2 isoform X1 [Cyprinus carpio]
MHRTQITSHSSKDIASVGSLTMRHMYLLSLVLLLALTENILMHTNCGDGYIKRRGKCVDENECESDPSICGKNARCFNTVGSYYCQCHEGFTTNSAYNFTPEDGIECEDINECVVGSAACGPYTKCVNSEGGYNCTCEAGYISSNGKDTFKSGQGVQCNELMCDRLLNERKASQAFPEFKKLVSLMTNSCLNQSEPVSMNNSTGDKRDSTQGDGDGERFLQAFLNALDDLLHGGFSSDNAKVSALFSIVESMLKLIGPQLSASQTRRVSAKTDVELLLKRGNSPPEGEFMMNTSGAQFTSHWDTATGNNHLGFTTAALLSYKGLEESLNCSFDHLKTQQKQTFKINSKVVTATVSNKETTNLTKPINLTFSHLEKKNEEHMCVFWDPELDGGAWSTRGCTTVISSADQTDCSCSHLSSFAVLMALYDIGDVYELRVVTLVGLSLSLICFFICIVTFYFVRSIQSTRNTIHLHLCISLFIAYFVFLVGITRTENKVGCAVVAGILHYFFLASFCWMCLEGVQLFRMVVLVFNTTLRPIYMFAAGYGVPAVIVAISATANASGYGTDKHCWLSIQDGFIWSFYGPVCIIIIANVFFFLITIWKLAEKFSSLNPDLDSLHKIKAFTVTAIAQLCILGIMWVFGCFQFNENTLAMSYIFTILSSLQGVLMFIMHCWLSKQVRDEYAKFLSCICTPQKRKYSEFTSNQTSKQQASRSDTHTGESHI